MMDPAGRPVSRVRVRGDDRAGHLAAIDALNGAEFQGRRLTVNEAKPRDDRGGGSGGRRGGGGVVAEAAVTESAH